MYNILDTFNMDKLCKVSYMHINLFLNTGKLFYIILQISIKL